ncbi:MAG: MoxR family ATPase [Pseudomonadota bacterium]
MAESRAAAAAAQAPPDDVDDTVALLASAGYVASRGLAAAAFLALRLNRPLFLEGEAGVGKTELAKVLASALRRDLIRLQCYEGLDLASAAYEWDYPRQLLHIRAAERQAPNTQSLEQDLYRERYLIERPLLRALRPRANGAPVLLIDELDRADPPFEAFLLELLEDFQLSIPELGTVRAPMPPIVVLTSNRTRDVHDALKRRCLYHWVDYPDTTMEQQIVANRAPQVSEALRGQIVAFIHGLREQALLKAPGVAETLDWANALTQLGASSLTDELVDDTLGTLLKYQDDMARIRGPQAARLLAQVQGER